MLRTCVLLAVCAQMDARTFKAAFFYNGDISDLGWTYTHNEGRIRAQEALLPELEARGDSIHTDIFEALSSEDVKVMMKNVSESGYDMVIGCSFMYHEETFAAAKAHPNVDFVHVSGYYSGQDNFITAFGRVYHSRYVSGVVAGGKSTVKRVGFIASIPIAEVYRSANAYYLGAQVGAGAIMNSTYVEHKVDAVVIWIGTFYDPVKEREAARRLHAMGCDVIAYHTDTQEGALYAKANGIHSVASNTDGRKIIGETVLTSSNFNWEPIYTELMNRSYSGTFRNGSHNLWYGYPSGVSVNHDPSFEVDTPTRKLFHSTVTKMKGGFDPFCHPVWKGGVRVQEKVGDCLDDFHLAVKMDYTIDGISDTGNLILSGDACGNGTRYTVAVTQNPPSYVVECHNCTAGTYSVVTDHEACPAGSFSQEFSSSCSLCPEGSFSEEGAEICHVCPSGMKNFGEGNIDCPFSEGKTDKNVIIVISVIIGAFLLIGAPLAGFRVLRDQVRLSKLYSEKAVAFRCAQSIAYMRLEDLDDIRGLENPSDIILAFMKIVDNLIEYRRYLPRTLLAKYADDTSDVESETATSISVTGSNALTHTITNKSESHIGTDRNTLAQGGHQRMGNWTPSLSKKKVSFLMANVIGFHSDMMNTRENDVIAKHKQYIQMCIEVSHGRGGVPETFSGDRVVITYNGARPITSFRESATLSGLEILSNAESSLQLRISSAVVAGTVLSGHIGADTMKRYSTLGKCVSWGYSLERYAKIKGYGLITDSSIYEACEGVFDFRHFGFVKSNKGPREGIPLVVSRVLAELTVLVGEWMYQLEEVHESPAHKLNKAFVAVEKQRWDDAVEILKTIDAAEIHSRSSYEEISHMSVAKEIASYEIVW